MLTPRIRPAIVVSLLAVAASAPAQVPATYEAVLFAADVMVPMREACASPPTCIGPCGAACRSRTRCRCCSSARPTARPDAAGRTVAVLRRARLRGGPAGHAGTVRIRGHVLEVPRLRRPGRLRHGRVGRRTPLCLGRRRHVRHLLRRAHAGGRGEDEPAAPAGAAAKPGRHLAPVGAQGPQPRRVRAGPAARLGVRPAPGLARPRWCGPRSRRKRWPTGSRRCPCGRASAHSPRRPSSRTTCSRRLTRADDDDPDADFRHWDRIGVSWRRYYGRTADVPMLHVAGWYDPYCGSMFENYLGLSAVKTAPQRLLVGPWTHGGNTRSYAGDVDFGPDAALPDFCQRTAPAVVRPPSEGTAHRSRRLAAHPPVRDGRRGTAARTSTAGWGTAATGATRRSGRCPRRNRRASTSTRTAR